MAKTEDRFGFEWQRYHDIKPEYHEQYLQQFLNWTYPIEPEFYKGKTILDAGCGMGRNAYWCLRWGAKRLVACDHDARSVAAAKETLKEFPNVEVYQYDLEELPWDNEFDFVLSIGVVHHTEHPERVMERFYTALKPGGEVLLWVYSVVGFEFIPKILDPIRKRVTSKMNLQVLHFLTYGLSVPLYLYLRFTRPSRKYFQQLRTFSLSHLHSILFDQLLPPIARYYTKEQAAELVARFRDVSIISPPNDNGWIVRGKK
ncbi:MAG: hypothetical protein A3B30_04380 [Candidatus Komeilibacteria bacterium RIFCSPLOWO2_01_FULL_52_15]|uniref:Methyltransferase type 11 domain-containing protein n=2 Tax=Candidatus Komeiliibacteriota TaxID=1817908 RepID=A0A1G2BPU1_9BACT|nr:MAG: hypothetical protein A2677_04140 [Candidatus Komeilibacteria bacterium RIFCSPHIGHO2_01_FULL_52_14]OGY91118.1 MAG: hypothetical protein A3B30_04380 [Candidatus Komeilibacteria bacterium RIFCSPLOWO2_01_FULL_52_15]